MTKPLLKIAIDPGFGDIKVAAVVADSIQTITLPSLVGVGDTNMGLLQSGLSRQKKQTPHQITFSGGQALLVGQFVDLYTRPSMRLDSERLGDSVEQRALVLTALGLMAYQIAQIDPACSLDGTIHLAVIVALPVHVLQGPEAQQVQHALESWMLGEHIFDLDGQPFHLNIHALMTRPQPLGAFLEWGLTPAGQWGRPTTDFRASTAILDQGFNTADLLLVSGGQIIKRFTGGDTLGMRRASEVMQELLHKAGRRVSLYEADRYIRQSCNGQKVELVISGQSMDLKPLARQALDSAAGTLKQFLSQVWEDGKTFDYILLTGGGILALGERIRSTYPNAIELADPVTANARGLARYAQRPGLFKLNRVA